MLESIKAGARGFVVRPFLPDRVIEAVGKASSSPHLRVLREPASGGLSSFWGAGRALGANFGWVGMAKGRFIPRGVD